MNRHRCGLKGDRLAMPLILACVGVLAAVHVALAGSNQDARLCLALQPAGGGRPCERATPDTLIQVRGALAPARYYAMVLVTQGDPGSGIGGAHFGIRYDGRPGAGVDVISWSACGAEQVADTAWPEAGSGISLAWDDCRRQMGPDVTTGVMAIVGYFYCTAYGFDSLSVRPHPIDDAATVQSCFADTDTIEAWDHFWFPSHLGSITFSPGGLIDGHDPTTLTSEPVNGGLAEDPAVAAMARLLVFPYTVIMGRNQWLFVQSQVYRPGSQINFWYDRRQMALMADGAIYNTYRPWSKPRSYEELAQTEWRRRATARIHAAVLAGAEKPWSVGIAELDSAGYELTPEPVNPMGISIRSRQSGVTLASSWSTEWWGQSQSVLIRPVDRARTDALAGDQYTFNSPSPWLDRRTPYAGYSGGSQAFGDVIALLESACGGASLPPDSLTTDRDLLSRLGLGPGDVLRCMP